MWGVVYRYYEQDGIKSQFIGPKNALMKKEICKDENYFELG